MALFSRATTDAAQPVLKAAAGSNVGMSQIDNFYAYTQGNTRQRAMSVPAITRARDLLASVISCTPLKQYQEMWNPVDREMEEIDIAPRSWLRRLDPALPNATLFAWLFVL